MAQTETVKGKKEKRTASKSRKNGIGEFFIDKIDGDVMRKFIKAESLDIDTDDMTDEQIGVAIFSHFGETTADENKVQCDNCNGISSDAYKSCPYCGAEGDVEDEVEASSDDEDEEKAETSSDDDTEEETESEDEEEEVEASDAEDEDEEEEEKPAKKKASSKKSKAVAKASSDDDEEEEVKASDEDDEEEVEASEDEEEGEDHSDSDDEDESDDEEEEKVEAASPKKRGRPKGSTKKGGEKQMTTTEHVNGASKKSVAALATTTKGELTVRALDKAVAEVIRLRSDGAENYWHLGHKLAEINKKQLWKLRLDPKTGKKVYSSFEAFVLAELKMSREHAYNAIDVSQKYPDVAEVRALGQTKAALLLKAAPQDRAKLTAKAKAGATKRELAKDVKESRAKHGSPKAGKKAQAGAKGAAARTKNLDTKSEKISIATLEGSKTIKLFKKPESLRGFDPKEAVRATSLKDGPFGFFEMANGVVQYYHIFLKDGALAMKIQTTRIVPSDDSDDDGEE